MARMPLPQPTSTAFTVSAGSSVASISRQPRVVAWVPVPKARPASMRSGSRPAGRPSLTCEGCTQKGPTAKGRKERWFSATQSMSGKASQRQSGTARPSACAAASIAAVTSASSPSPNTSMRQGPSRETSQLATMKPSSPSRSSSRISQSARCAAGATKPALRTLLMLMPEGRACAGAASPRRHCRRRPAARCRTGTASRSGSRCRRCARHSARWRPGIRDA